MKKVTCTLPNVSDEINGVKFKVADDVAVAVVEDDVAKQFDGIEGYEIVDAEAKASRTPKATKPATVEPPEVTPAPTPEPTPEPTPAPETK